MPLVFSFRRLETYIRPIVIKVSFLDRQVSPRDRNRTAIAIRTVPRSPLLEIESKYFRLGGSTYQ
jgi:hypothetical protein